MRRGLLLLGFCLTGFQLAAQSSDKMTRLEYFETYGAMAVHEMHRSGVPASITLAQGALESGDGNSRLARMGNNHFGIKCHDDWNGRKVYEDDDSRNECFRKYPSVEDSYRDHSDYLLAKQRYAFLFDLNPVDYKAWARGLKKAGYATNSSYAEALIRIIEEFDLHKYDTMDGAARPDHRKPRHVNEAVVVSRQIFERNRVKYIEAKPGDTYESLAQELGKLEWEIPRYNDSGSRDSIYTGQIIYLQPKRNKAEAGRKVHIVKPGESLYSISQLYAIKLTRLRIMNQLDFKIQPAPGTELQLRKSLKGVAPKPLSREPLVDDEEEEEIKVDLNLE